MIQSLTRLVTSAALGLLLSGVSLAEKPVAEKPATGKPPSWQDTKPDPNAPSREQILWTQTDVGYSLEGDLSVLGRGHTDFGQGRISDAEGVYSSVHHMATVRKFMAILLHSGLEWQRIGLGSDSLQLPHSLNTLNAFFGTDFRWSSKGQVRIQVQPGFFSDFEAPTLSDMNMPMAVAYTHIPSKRFQWTVAASVNTWRATRFLPGGGLRWYINDRWKLKLMLPEPVVEYRAAPTLHLSVGADFRGDTYRMSSRHGDERGDPSLNRALLDYQEIRVGGSFSWNIRPLIALYGQSGYMLERTFDFHNNNLRGSSDAVPFVRIGVRMLFQLVKDPRPISVQVRSMQYEFPVIRRLMKIK